MSKETLAIENFKLLLDNGLYLEGDVKVSLDGGAKPVTVISHGFRGHKDWAFWPEVSKRLAESGFYTVLFNFSRISARSAADLTPELVAEGATLSRELADLEQVLAGLQKSSLPFAEAVDLQRISLLGHSRAGGSNILFAAKHPEVKALVVWNGGSAPVRQQDDGAQALTLQELAIQEDLERNKEHFGLEDALSSLSAATLIIQGDRDRESLLQQNLGFQKRAPQHRYLSVKGADHTFNTVDPYEGATSSLNEAIAQTINFLQDKLG